MDAAPDEALFKKTGDILVKANIEYSARRFAKAWPRYVEALEVGEDYMNRDEQLGVRDCLTECLIWCKEYRRAETYDRRTLGLLESWTDSHGPEHNHTVRARQNLARDLSYIYLQRKSETAKLAEAVCLHRKNLTILVSRTPVDDETRLETQSSLAHDLAKQGNYTEAAELTELVLRRREKSNPDPDDRRTIGSRHNHANVLYRLKRFEQAKLLLIQNEDIIKSLSDSQRASYDDLSRNGARCLAKCIKAAGTQHSKSKGRTTVPKKTPDQDSSRGDAEPLTTGGERHEQSNPPVHMQHSTSLNRSKSDVKTSESDVSETRSLDPGSMGKPRSRSATDIRAPSPPSQTDLEDILDPGDQFKADGSRNDADKWFVWLRSLTHRLLYSDSVEPKNPGRRRVRVAIIDSGVTFHRDGEEHHARANKWLSRGTRKHRIAEYRDFTGRTPSMADSRKDFHGTNCASLLLQVAPEADVYCANVVVPGVRGQTAGHVAEALRWAIDEWRVDVISMSFGWDFVKPEVDAEIDRARRENILLFAATNNESAFSRDHGSFPACQPTVFCAYACSGAGERSRHNPDASKEKINFMFLGEAISLLEDSARAGPVFPEPARLTGNSFAAPIAAGTAALVLDLVRLQMPPHEAQRARSIEWRLKRYEGMAAVFKAMSGDPRHHEYYFVRPWKLLGQRRLQMSPDGPDPSSLYGSWSLERILDSLERFGDI